MEEIVFWKEVDVKDEQKLKSGDYLFAPPNKWLKRVVINILSDQEITDEAETIYPYDEDRMNKYDFENQRYQGVHFAAIKNYQKELLKAMQERLIGGQGL